MAVLGQEPPRSLRRRIEEAIRRLHPTKYPEILALAILAGNKAYLAWIDAEVDRRG